ncbi:family 1 glycosylhydrolase [Nonomuraea turkmeniaca]|uniref:family 1 glycosylhydrolase n=1 Tax=Nonomuraea turkmeniaca TaxID=103838 RepID=UPI001FEBFCBA|nr:family 1 glycosylhydrolase [Nonomuraea turkmeniaca]
MHTFPNGFLWGAATAPHQVEGDNVNSDFWAQEEHVDVRGYIHWSLLDNYEWGHWDPTFGLVAVDRETFERRPEPSLAWLGGAAKANAV